MKVEPIQPVRPYGYKNENLEEKRINKVKEVLDMYKDVQINLASEAARDEIAINIVKNLNF